VSGDVQHLRHRRDISELWLDAQPLLMMEDLPLSW
jgi:hypothetical protein